MYVPYKYDQINIIESSYNPSMVKAYNNQAFNYWSRSLFQRASYKLKFTLPDEWKGEVHDFFIYCLFKFGFVGVFDDVKQGKSFQPGTLKGLNFYYQPINFLVANPLLHKEFTIGKDCELIKLTPDYMGIFDIITYYAEKLAVLDNAINISLINNKVSYILGAKNRASANALKKVLDKINKGEPAVVYDQRIENDSKDKDTPFQMLERGALKNGYITTDQLKDFQTILNNFDAEIGITTTPYQKAERMVTDEANSRAEDSQARCTIWYETLQESIKKVNDMFNLNIKVEMRKEEGDNGETLDNGVRKLSLKLKSDKPV